VLILAVSDVHAPVYFKLFSKLMDYEDFSAVSLFLMAGDMIYKGKIRYYDDVIKCIRSKYEGPLIGIFGNEEYEDRIHLIRERYSDEVIWLYDESISLNIDNKKVTIVGTKGSLAKPTAWQSKNIPNINEIYRERERKIEKLLLEARDKSDVLILLSHYAITNKTMKGEDPKIWPMLGSPKFEKILLKTRVDIAIHGHVHNSKVWNVVLNKTRIYNVALPATRKITHISLIPISLTYFM